MILLASYSLSPHWAFNPWLVVLLVLVAGGLVVYLYRAQQKVASRRVVVALTTIRLLLVLLMFVLLAGLSVRWSRTGAAGGTLWVLVDNSASMGQRDARATAVEKLRWADALGFVPAELRPSKLDRHAARLAALKADLAFLRTRGELASGPGDGGREAIEFAAGLREWGDRLRAVADDLAADAEVKRAGGTVATGLRDTAQRANAGAEKAAAAKRRDEAARGVPWAELQAGIDAAQAPVVGLADAADNRLLTEKAADPTLKAALDKVGGMTRSELARAALGVKSGDGVASIADLVPRQATKVITFADTPQAVGLEGAGGVGAALKAAAAPVGQSTNLAAALRYVHDQLGPDEPASVVVVSDGRHNNGGDLVEPARLLASRGVRVFTLAMGSEQVAADAAVEQVDAPDWVYHEDTLRASALLRLDGLKGKPVTVELYRGDKKVESKTVTPGEERATAVVHFEDKPPEAGVFEYGVRVAELPDEAVKENNRLGHRVAVKQDKLAVLVVEDMPRWEYRHLVAYLSRDRRVKLQTVLLQPARVENVSRPTPMRASPSNEGVEAQLLPQEVKDWAAFDLVVLGDVPREALNEQDQQNLAAAVRDRGLTLMMIAGPFNMPQRFAGTALEGLVPVELTGEWPPGEMERHLKSGFKPAVTAEGKASILGQFTIDEEANAATWAALPAWYWHSALTAAKRSANVVWTIGETNETETASQGPSQTPSQPRAEASASGSPSSSDPSRERALLCTMSVGMGRVIYLASDSTWRMRQVGGGNAQERFWGQVVRFVVDQELPAGGERVRYGSDRTRYVVGEGVVVTARLLGDDSGALTGQKIRVAARLAGKAVGQAEMVELPDAPGHYRATVGGLPAGSIELSLQGEAAERLLAQDTAAARNTLRVEVQSQLGVEQRNVNADRATMRRVAEAAGGIGLDGPYGDVLAGHVPKLNYQTERAERVGLFASPGERYARLSHWVFLGAFVLLASAEWIIRKSAGLV